jgi:uncharacterized protein (TIGR03067 family)
MDEAEVIRRLQGIWEVTSYIQDGSAMPAVIVNSSPTITFTGKEFRFGDGGTGRIVAIDATKRPIAIDYQYTSGPKAGVIELAIVEFNGDTFRDCMAPPGAPRPFQFAATQVDGNTLVNYRHTTQERGPGLLFNPWFYLCCCCGVSLAFVLFLTSIIILVIWLANRPSYPR